MKPRQREVRDDIVFEMTATNDDEINGSNTTN